MAIQNKLRKVLYNTIILIIAGLTVTGFCFSKEIKKVALLPFVMNTQQDLTFLQKGIFDMFSSRISYGDEVEVLTREILENKLAGAGLSIAVARNINELKARELGKALNVDYVLFGSLTLFGNSMSLDVKVVDVKYENPALTFFRQGNDSGAVIPELDKVAQEINFKVFGRENLEFQSRQALQKTYPVQDQATGFASPLKNFQTLLSVNGTLNGVATGDLDGDKKNEIVVIHGRIIKIFKYAFNGKINLVKKIEASSVAMNLVSIDVADINRNGFSEIFVTRINNQNQSVASQMIEYNGSEYVVSKTTYPWYLRVIQDYQGNAELIGQVHSKQGPWASKNVFKVDWQNNKYIPGQRLRAPKTGFSVLSMVSGNMSGTEPGSYLYTNEKGQLIAFNDSGKTEWSSDEGYGGSSFFYAIPQHTQNALYTTEYKFLQPKSAVYDMDGDGNAELFVIKNYEISENFFKNTRLYKKGSIEIFNLNELGLAFDNAPKKFPGPVTSIDIGDFDNDGKAELLVVMLKKKSGLLSNNSTSVLIVYDLN
ncbi:MAG: VCBS repeat-containing protein [Desulfobacula sp.]|nr:VCBS repeat-containing protein [Desulfobacula sp.]